MNAFPAEAVRRGLKVKLVGPDVDETPVEGPQLFDLISELVLTDGLELQAFLTLVGHLDLAIP